MTERPQPPSQRRWPAGLRWAGCFVLVVGLHATALAALMDHWRANDEPVANGPVILVDLAPVAAAPTTPPNDVAPPPKPEPKPALKLEPKPEPKPEKAQKIEKPESTKPEVTAKPAPKPPEKPAEPRKPTVTADLKPAPDPPVDKIAPTPGPLPLPPPPVETHAVTKDVVIPLARPVRQIRKQKVRERKHRQRVAKLTPEPARTKRRASRAVAPRAGARAHDRNAVPRWKTALVMRLQRYKRYPVAAQERGVQGVAQLAFSVDRSGRVHHARIVRSSGSALLDRSTMQLIARAQPLPPPPPEIRSALISIVVPISYNLR
jgi:protein TonB